MHMLQMITENPMFPCQFYPAHCTEAMYPAEVPPTVAAPAGLPVGAWQPEGEEGGGSRVERSGCRRGGKEGGKEGEEESGEEIGEVGG